MWTATKLMNVQLSEVHSYWAWNIVQLLISRYLFILLTFLTQLFCLIFLQVSPCSEEELCVPVLRPRNKRRRQRLEYAEYEESNLMEGVRKMGKRWNQILLNYDFHPSRTKTDIKDKYKSMIVSWDNGEVVSWDNGEVVSWDNGEVASWDNG